MSSPVLTQAYRPVSGMAVAGFCLSLTVVFSALGLIFSAIGYYQLKSAGQDCPVLGKNLAVSGIVIGASLTFVWVTALVLKATMGFSVAGAVLGLVL